MPEFARQALAEAEPVPALKKRKMAAAAGHAAVQTANAGDTNIEGIAAAVKHEDSKGSSMEQGAAGSLQCETQGGAPDEDGGRQHFAKATSSRDSGSDARAAGVKLSLRQEGTKESCLPGNAHDVQNSTRHAHMELDADSEVDKPAGARAEVLADVEYLGEGCTSGKELGKLDLAMFDNYSYVPSLHLGLPCMSSLQGAMRIFETFVLMCRGVRNDMR
jgi:hypothetical protein